MESRATPGAGLTVVRGAVFSCPVCGAEISVVRTGGGTMSPRCCNTQMVLTKRVNSIYVCLTCGSEIMLVRGDRKRLEPVCCNRPMQMPVAGSL